MKTVVPFFVSYAQKNRRRADACRMPMPSLETLDFFGQLLECASPRDREAAVRGLNGLLETRTPEAGEWARFDGPSGRVLAASPGAWRSLGWSWVDPETGRLRRLPAEHFGDLPRDDAAASVL